MRVYSFSQFRPTSLYLRDGSVVLTSKPWGIVSRLIRWHTGEDETHAVRILRHEDNELWMWEAHPFEWEYEGVTYLGGVRCMPQRAYIAMLERQQSRPITRILGGLNPVVYSPCYTREQLRGLLEHARSVQGSPYRIRNWFKQVPGTYHCSQFVGEGDHYIGLHPEYAGGREDPGTYRKFVERLEKETCGH